MYNWKKDFEQALKKTIELDKKQRDFNFKTVRKLLARGVNLSEHSERAILESKIAEPNLIMFIMSGLTDKNKIKDALEYYKQTKAVIKINQIVKNKKTEDAFVIGRIKQEFPLIFPASIFMQKYNQNIAPIQSKIILDENNYLLLKVTKMYKLYFNSNKYKKQDYLYEDKLSLGFDGEIYLYYKSKDDATYKHEQIISYEFNIEALNYYKHIFRSQHLELIDIEATLNSNIFTLDDEQYNIVNSIIHKYYKGSMEVFMGKLFYQLSLMYINSIPKIINFNKNRFMLGFYTKAKNAGKIIDKIINSDKLFSIIKPVYKKVLRFDTFLYIIIPHIPNNQICLKIVRNEFANSIKLEIRIQHRIILSPKKINKDKFVKIGHKAFDYGYEDNKGNFYTNYLFIAVDILDHINNDGTIDWNGITEEYISKLYSTVIYDSLAKISASMKEYEVKDESISKFMQSVIKNNKDKMLDM